MSVKVEIYTRQYCNYCQRAKDLLQIKGVSFVEHDITDDHLKAAEMQRHSQSQRVPNIFIDDVSIGSCTELFDLDEKGTLNALLGLEPRTVTLSLY
jgi:glutaredoxin 3